MDHKIIDRNFNVIMLILILLAILTGFLGVKASNKADKALNSKVGMPINRNSLGCVEYRFKIDDKIQDVWACPDGIQTRTVKATYCDPVFKKYFCQVTYYKIFEGNPYDR